MSKHDHLWNSMPLDERKRLAPYMIENQILHLRQVRAVIIRAHATELHELDEWIKNCERSLREEEASTVSPSDCADVENAGGSQ